MKINKVKLLITIKLLWVIIYLVITKLISPFLSFARAVPWSPSVAWPSLGSSPPPEGLLIICKHFLPYSTHLSIPTGLLPTARLYLAQDVQLQPCLPDNVCPYSYMFSGELDMSTLPFESHNQLDATELSLLRSVRLSKSCFKFISCCT